MWEILGRTRSPSIWAIAVAPLVILATACDGGSDQSHAAAASTVVAPRDGGSTSRRGANGTLPALMEVFAPDNGDVAGIGGIGWFVDIAVEFTGKTLKQTGFTQFELTGPGGHANISPFPAPAGPGRDESFPGLVVFCSTSSVPGQNLAGLFNLVGVTNLKTGEGEVELWDTWIAAAPVCGTSGLVKIWFALVDDLNGNGIYDDAPDVVPDANGDGVIDGKDLQALGLASNLEVKEFFLHS